MATQHQQQLAGYLARHKKATAALTNASNADSKNSELKTSKGPSKAGNVAAKQVHNSPSASNPATRSRTKQSVPAPRPQAGRNTNLNGFLPDELMLKIFGYLDIVCLLQCSQVSKRWYSLASDDSLWKNIADKYIHKEGQSKKTEKVKNSNDVAAHTEKTEKVQNSNDVAPHTETFKEQWKSVCISRCAKWRNEKAMKMMKKSRTNPFTGLPKETEKVLKQAGVSFQLSLVDSYGKENCTASSKLTMHKSAASCTWHSLTFVKTCSVRKMRILAICPLFYNDGGRVVKGSPYQRSLMWEDDVRLSDYTTEDNMIAEDDQVMMYRLPADLLLGTWKADGEIAFLVAGLHYDHLVQRCLLGSPSQCYVPPSRKVILDDIDSSYGLHDYRCTVELRRLHQTLWSQQFSMLHCRLHDLALGAARFTLIGHDSVVDHTPLENALGFSWRTELFKGSVENAAWLDITVLDERGEIFFAASAPVKAQTPTVRGADLEYEESQHLVMQYNGDRASVSMQIGKLDHGKAFVRHLEIRLRATAINEWFGTKYLAADLPADKDAKTAAGKQKSKKK